MLGTNSQTPYIARYTNSIAAVAVIDGMTIITNNEHSCKKRGRTPLRYCSLKGLAKSEELGLARALIRLMSHCAAQHDTVSHRCRTARPI
jgi:hypothetical protein